MSTLRVEALEQPDGTAFVFNNKNLLINGGMNVWQRSTSVSGITSVGYYTADRYNSGGVGLGTWTQSRSTDVPSGQGFGYSLKMDCTTADASPAAGDTRNIQQRLEGQNLQHLLKGTSGAKKLTLSFWVKSNKTGTYIAELYDEDNTRQISQSYTIDTASTWEKKELVFDGDTVSGFDNDNAYSLAVVLWLGAGTDFTSGTLNTSWASVTAANRAVGQVNLADSTSNEWYVTGIQLEVGSTASGFEFEPYDTVLRKCQRYYHQLGGNAAYEVFAIGVVATSTLFDCLVFPPVTMRQNVTVSSVGSNFRVYTGDNSGADETVSNIAALNPTPSNISVRATTSSATVGRSGRLYASNDTTLRLKFDAEL
jgi:hypothetical protein